VSRRRFSWRAVTRTALLAAAVAVASGWLSLEAVAQTSGNPLQPMADATVDFAGGSWRDMVVEGMLRLPLAAVLGAALAFRPKRRGTPTRTPAVVQTQIILTIVGAVIMLVVGSSLARAFGIVGAASLIRYRSKVDDPKDAGVMLCGLAMGLASGVGLYGLAVFATVFLVALLALVESFDPNVNRFLLHATGIQDATALRPRFEQVLTRFGLEYSLRTQSNAELSYDIKVPFELETELVTSAILLLDKDGKIAVEWGEAKGKKQ
jgi:uncharacterized membrane protein YhiD involved in acid resistance